MIEYENLRELNRSFFEDYQKKFATVLESGWFILGEQVKEFENQFASYLGTKYCTGVASGLDALTLALKALHLEEDSEVLIPSNTYIATFLAIIQNGFKPVPVEPDIKTYNIDPKKIEENITARTKAIIVVHLYGKSCDMDPILDICKRHDLKLIEDCAQSHGAKYKGKMTGTFGDFGAFSFYPTKNLGALGDAGALTSNDASLNEEIRILRNYGSRVKYYNEQIGFNSRLDEIQASFLNIKFKSLDRINSHKRELAKLYLENLNDDFIKPFVHDDYFDVYHIFNIRHNKRDKLKEYLMEKGIKTDIHYPVSPNKQQAMKGILDHRSCPISEEIHRTTLSLPISYFHTKEDILYVIDCLNNFSDKSI
jgi:dTDP-4-amino-4,6-dideoxygalactose transaminase